MTFKNSMSLNRGILQNSKSNNIFVLIPKLDIKNSHLLTKGKKKKPKYTRVENLSSGLVIRDSVMILWAPKFLSNQTLQLCHTHHTTCFIGSGWLHPTSIADNVSISSSWHLQDSKILVYLLQRRETTYFKDISSRTSTLQ